MMELHWDDTETYPQHENTRDEVAIAELELQLLEVASTVESSVDQEDQRFQRQWMAGRLY